MPLPPAPTQRASRLTHTAFEAQTTEAENAPVMVQVETKTPAAPVQSAVAMEPKRVARGRKAPTATAQHRNRSHHETGAGQRRHRLRHRAHRT